MLARGVLATNGELVERAVQILRAMNVRILGAGRGARRSSGCARWLNRAAGRERRAARRRRHRRRLGGPVPARTASTCGCTTPTRRRARKVGEVLENARRAYRQADAGAAAGRGRARRSSATPEEAVDGRRLRAGERARAGGAQARAAGARRTGAAAGPTWCSARRPRGCCRRGSRPTCTHPERFAVGASVQPGLPAAAGRGVRRRARPAPATIAARRRGVRVGRHAAAHAAQRDRRLHRRPADGGDVARGAVAGQRRRRHGRPRSTTRSASAPACAGRSWARS